MSTEPEQPQQPGTPQTEIVKQPEPERGLSARERELMDERKAIRVGSTGTTLRSWQDICTAATTLWQSGLAPQGLNDSWQKCAVAIQYALELGLPWFTGIQQIAVINGRATLWGDSVLALCRSSALFDESAFEEVLGDDVSTCTVRRNVDGAKPVTRSFSTQDARTANLLPAKEKSAWNTYPKRMRQMRARMWALRDAFPDLLRGMRSVEEAMDMPPDTPIVVTENQVRRLTGESKSDHLANVMEARKPANGTAGVASEAIGKEATPTSDQSAPAPAGDALPDDRKKTPTPAPRKAPAAKAAKAEPAKSAPQADHSPEWSMFIDVIEGITRGEMSLDDYNALLNDNLPYAVEHKQLTQPEADELAGIARQNWDEHANPQPKAETKAETKASGGAKQGSLV
jgi:hypothetical protein